MHTHVYAYVCACTLRCRHICAHASHTNRPFGKGGRGDRLEHLKFSKHILFLKFIYLSSPGLQFIFFTCFSFLLSFFWKEETRRRDYPPLPFSVIILAIFILISTFWFFFFLGEMIFVPSPRTPFPIFKGIYFLLPKRKKYKRKKRVSICLMPLRGDKYR